MILSVAVLNRLLCYINLVSSILPHELLQVEAGGNFPLIIEKVFEVPWALWPPYMPMKKKDITVLKCKNKVMCDKIIFFVFSVSIAFEKSDRSRYKITGLKDKNPSPASWPNHCMLKVNFYYFCASEGWWLQLRCPNSINCRNYCEDDCKMLPLTVYWHDSIILIKLRQKESPFRSCAASGWAEQLPCVSVQERQQLEVQLLLSAATQTLESELLAGCPSCVLKQHFWSGSDIRVKSPSKKASTRIGPCFSWGLH